MYKLNTIFWQRIFLAQRQRWRFLITFFQAILQAMYMYEYFIYLTWFILLNNSLHG